MFSYIDVHVYYPKEHYPELWQIPPETLYIVKTCIVPKHLGVLILFLIGISTSLVVQICIYCTCNLIFKYFTI